MRKTFNTIFSRNFVAVSLINLIMMSAYYMLMVTITSYSLTELKASHSVAGLITGSMVLGLLAGRFVSGKLISILNFKTLLFLGIGEYLVFMGCYFLAATPEQLLVVRFLSGFGVGLVSTVTGTIVAHILPHDLMGTGISYYSLSTILATALGPFLGLFMMQGHTFDLLFLFCLASGVLSGVVVFALTIIRPPGVEEKPAQANARKKSGMTMEDFIDYRTIPISMVVLLCGFGYSSIQAFISSYAREIDLMEAAGLFFIVYAAVILLSRPVTGKIMDKKGPNMVVYPSLILFSAGLLLLSFVNSWWTFLLAGALVGIGFGNFQSTAQAVAIKMVPEHRFGHATSTFFIFLDVSVGIGPFLLGFIVAHMSYAGLYQSMSVLALACVGVYYFLQANRPTYEQSRVRGTGASRAHPPVRGSLAHAKDGDAKTPR